ncbi:PAS domain S-box protein [Bdellovibrionota bacterium FG-1]
MKVVVGHSSCCTANRYIASTIRLLRQNAGLSQEKLSELAGLDRTYVSYIETNRRNVTTATLEKVIPHISSSSFEFYREMLQEASSVCREQIASGRCTRLKDSASACFMSPSGVSVEKISEQLASSSNYFVSDYLQAVDHSLIVGITDSAGRIVHANDEFCRVFKYSREEMIGRDNRILNSGYHPKEFFRELWATVRSGRVWRGEVRDKAKDGGVLWLDTMIIPVTQGAGKPMRFMVIRKDMTDRKLQDQLSFVKKNDELQRGAFDVVSDFSRGIVRELSHPLGLILDSIQKTRTEVQAHSVMGEIEKQAQRIGDVVRSLQSFTPDSPSASFEKTAASDLLARTLSLSLQSMTQNGVKFKFPEVPPADLAIECRPAQMIQVFRTFLLRAHESASLAPEGSRWIGLRVFDRADDVEFSLSDSGPKLTQEEVGHLFQPFQDVTSGATLSGGLAFCVAMGVVLEHRGNISVDPRDANTHFVIRIPKAQKTQGVS